jgi:hypothetical protein
MSAHAAAGLAALNALFLAVGWAILWALRGFRAWSELAALAGVAYLVGVATISVLATELLVAGAPVGVPVVLPTAAAVVAIALVFGRRCGRELPVRATAREPRREPLRALGWGAAALTVLYLGDFLRAARLQPLYVPSQWDAWSSWITKAKSIYLLGGLDAKVFPTLFLPGYPILAPALEAMSFHFMGSADTTVVHVQFWLLLAGFVFAVAGLLRPAVPLAIVWPFLLLLVVLPELNVHALSPQADLTMDYFFAAGGLAIAAWTVRREPWLLWTGGILLGAAMCTKREGYLFGAALLVAAGLATAREARRTWPRLVLVGAAGFLTTVPWLLWRSSHHLSGQLEGTSSAELSSRAGAAASSVAHILFGVHFWSLAGPLCLAAALVVAIVPGSSRRLALLSVVTLAVAFAGLTWVLAAGIEYTLGPLSDQNPVPRASGAVILLSLALAPLLLGCALRREPPPG